MIEKYISPLEWHGDGNCRDENPDLFFHPDGERGNARKSRAEAAKKICSTSEVKPRCRIHALSRGEEFGTWGGLSEKDRSDLSRSAKESLLAEAVLELESKRSA